MSALLSLHDVTVMRGSPILEKITLDIGEGEVVALVGPSGSGKSTLLRILLGLVAPTRGVVKIRDRVASVGEEGRDMIGKRSDRIRIPPEERDLAVVFQDLALWPHLTVAGNLRFVLRSRRRPRAEERDRIQQMLEQVGLAGFEGRYPGELSGGEQQRVAIARALVLDPTAVLLDEPLANLDLSLKQELIALLGELFRNRGTTVVYVTHDPREIAALTSRIVILEAGRITYSGPLAGLPDTGSSFSRMVRQATPPNPTEGGGGGRDLDLNQ